MKEIAFIILFILSVSNLSAAEIWDIMNKTMNSWNSGSGVSAAWTTSIKDGSATVTQESGYTNITKTVAAEKEKYGFFISQGLTLSSGVAYTFEIKARINPIDKMLFPDGTSRAEGYELAQIGARLRNKTMIIYLKYGNETEGYITLSDAATHSEGQKYPINTSDWHRYRFVLYADNSEYDVYIDDIEDPVFENVTTGSVTGSNILKLGADSWQRCNMDIESAKIGTGDFNSKAKIVSLSVSSDCHIVGNARTITATANTVLINNGENISFSLIDNEGNTVVDAVNAAVASNRAEVNFTIPSTIDKGQYWMQATVENNKIGNIDVLPKTMQYVIVDSSPIEGGLFPDVKPVGFMADINDYQYQPPSKEFIFPAIVDTKPYTGIDGKFLNGEEPLARYYLFYTPHNDPGGMFLATGPTLDGPWTERGTVMDLAWAKAISGNVISTTSHISTCQVIWNEIADKYFMYFHGPNTTTHYATSDNLTDWTFGSNILTAQSFGSKGDEASYAKVFEYAVPGLDNKYIILLMVAESLGGNLKIRRIYWAHSQNGINWTCIKNPLISPELEYKKIPGTSTKPSYYLDGMGSNVSNPFFMERNGRCFVFFNGSSGNICVVEVGEKFDMEVHWGEYMKAKDVLIDKDDNGYPIAVSRVAAPAFIQDDEGAWYLFFEAGNRLGANIAYAKELKQPTFIRKEICQELVSISNNVMNRDQPISIKTLLDGTSLSEVTLCGIAGNEIYRHSVSGSECTVNLPVVSGLYVLTVGLSNGISKGFKVLMK